jgi:hypothetical protein
VNVLLLSTYDLGRQPFGLASPAAWLRRAGLDVATRDLSRDALDEDEVRRAALIAFYLPMHTATRLAVPVIDTIRRLNGTATIAVYGLYAALSASLLREHGVSVVLGAEAEADLVSLARGDGSGRPRLVAPDRTVASLPRLPFLTPARDGLPSLDRYASLQMPDGTIRIAGATGRPADASIAAAIARSSRCTTGSSASCRSRSCLRTSISRLPLAPNTSHSAIRISSTAPRTPAASSRRCTTGIRC